MQGAFVYVFKALTNLYLLAFLLRFILQWIRASYDNPLSQAVVRITNPLVVPARRMLPSIRAVDVPTLVVLFVLECLVTGVLLALIRAPFLPIPTFLFYVILRLVSLTLWLYIGAIFIYVLLSWFQDPRAYNPMTKLLHELLRPVLRPVSRILPPIGGLDLTPLLVSILLIALTIALPLPPVLR
jgi:YggT family protein